MQQIYRRTPVPKCDFNKVAKQLFSCKFAAYFQNIFFKEHFWVTASEITLQFNEGICSSKCAESFTLANITPAFKQGPRNLTDYYRPVSILPIISKISCAKQLSNHFDNIFLKFQWDFWKGFGVQHCLLLMIEKWKK